MANFLLLPTSDDESCESVVDRLVNVDLIYDISASENFPERCSFAVISKRKKIELGYWIALSMKELASRLGV